MNGEHPLELGAELVHRWANAKPTWIALVGETRRDVQHMAERILASAGPDSSVVYHVSQRRLAWSNGSVAFLYSAAEPNLLLLDFSMRLPEPRIVLTF